MTHISAGSPPPPTPGEGEDWAHAIGFILRLARALHTYGYAAQPLEEVMALSSFRLGMSGEFFSTPTSIFAAFGERERTSSSRTLLAKQRSCFIATIL